MNERRKKLKINYARTVVKKNRMEILKDEKEENENKIQKRLD